MLSLNGSSKFTFLIVTTAVFAAISFGAASTNAFPIQYTYVVDTELQAEAVLEGDLVTVPWEPSGPGSDLDIFEIEATSPNNYWTSKILLTRTVVDDLDAGPFSYSIQEIFGQHITAPHTGESEKGPELTIGGRAAGPDPTQGITFVPYRDLGDELDLPDSRLFRDIIADSITHPRSTGTEHTDWIWSAFDRGKRRRGSDVLEGPDDTIRLRVFLEHFDDSTGRGTPRRLKRMLPEPGTFILFAFGAAFLILLGTTSQRFKKNSGVYKTLCWFRKVAKTAVA